MIGYITLDKNNLTEGEQGLYQTFMCGLCVSTKKLFGNIPRLTIGYDINFFNVLFHAVTKTPVTIGNHTCLAHPFKKRTILDTNEMTDIVSVANILLVYLDTLDDVIDGKSSRKIVVDALKPYYKKAQKMLPEMDNCFCKCLDELHHLERENCNSLDKVCHPFASLTENFGRQILKEKSNQYIETLCYNIGKWVYLIDALDDIEKDIKNKNYNPFVACYNGADKSFATTNFDEIKFVMYSVLNRIAQSYNDLNNIQYKCILENILLKSIRNKTEEILDKYKK